MFNFNKTLINKLLKSRLLSLLCILFLCNNTHAAITLPDLISDNMVIQQNVPVHIWGKAYAGEKINVNILGEKTILIANTKGNWETWLKPMKPQGNVSMTITGTNSITIKNILIGEVWIASGQSNMEWDVSQSDNAEKEIEAANYPMIRLFVPVKGISDTLKTMISGKWMICKPENIGKFTAVGYFFGRGLYKKLNVPIGLIEASWGATNCQAWTPMEAIKADPRLNYVNEDWQQRVNNYNQKLKEFDVEIEKLKNIEVNTSTKPKSPTISLKDKPSVIYNAVIAPISNYTIKGVIWYQGEANAYERVSYPYRYLFPAMIRGWREVWKQGDFPFLFVQLSTLYKHPFWPMLRESQTETLNLKNTAMAVSIDVGDSTNAHYKNKQIIGYRLELAARNLVYGEDIEYSGPVFRQATTEDNKIRLWFDHAQGLKSVDGNPLKGFMIAGDDDKYMEAKAIIAEGTILLYNSAIVKPMHVKYAFKDAPVVNLVNDAGLPAIPFRTNIKDTL